MRDGQGVDVDPISECSRNIMTDPKKQRDQSPEIPHWLSDIGHNHAVIVTRDGHRVEFGGPPPSHTFEYRFSSKLRQEAA